LLSIQVIALNVIRATLEIGCGFLRLGYHLINYLNKGNYYGMDISASAIEEAHTVINEQNLSNKEPTIFQNHDLKLRDPEIANQSFDYIFSYSVFTHLSPEKIEELLSNLSNALKNSGAYYTTIYREPDGDFITTTPTRQDYRYPIDFFYELGDQYDLAVEELGEDDFKQQTWLEIEPSQ